MLYELHGKFYTKGRTLDWQEQSWSISYPVLHFCKLALPGFPIPGKAVLLSQELSHAVLLAKELLVVRIVGKIEQ